MQPQGKAVAGAALAAGLVLLALAAAGAGRGEGSRGREALLADYSARGGGARFVDVITVAKPSYDSLDIDGVSDVRASTAFRRAAEGEQDEKQNFAVPVEAQDAQPPGLFQNDWDTNVPGPWQAAQITTISRTASPLAQYYTTAGAQ